MGFLPVKNHVFLWSFILTQLCKVILFLSKRWLFSWNTLVLLVADTDMNIQSTHSFPQCVTLAVCSRALPGSGLAWQCSGSAATRFVCVGRRIASLPLVASMCSGSSATKRGWRWHIELWASWSLIRHKRWMLVHIFTFQMQFACLQGITHRKPISASKGLCP